MERSPIRRASLLRVSLLAVGGLMLVGGLVLFTRPSQTCAALYLAVYGLVIVGSLLVERHRYQPPLDRTRGTWEPTGERFVDPTSGQMVAVYFNPETGERDYRPA